MSKARFIHPELWSSEAFVALSHGARLLFIGLFTIADDMGRGRATATYLQGALFPGDRKATKADVERWQSEVANAHTHTTEPSSPLVRFYTADGGLWYDLPGWTKHQPMRYKKRSKCPPFQGVPRFLHEGDQIAPLTLTPTVTVTATASTPREPADDEVVVTVPCVDGEFDVHEAKVNEWQETFRGINVAATLGRIRQWCIDNPRKQKTVRGATRFISNWLARDQDKRGGRDDTGGVTHEQPATPNRRIDADERRARLARVQRRGDK